MLPHRRVQPAASAVLDGMIDGEHEVAAVHGILPVLSADRNHIAARVAFHVHKAGGAAQKIVLPLFQPVLPAARVVFALHKSRQHPERHPFRIFARVFRLKPYAGEREAGKRGARLIAHAVLQRLIRIIGLGELRLRLFQRNAQQGADARGGVLRILDVLRHGVHQMAAHIAGNGKQRAPVLALPHPYHPPLRVHDPPHVPQLRRHRRILVRLQ